jgi:hypothetical protein
VLSTVRPALQISHIHALPTILELFGTARRFVGAAVWRRGLQSYVSRHSEARKVRQTSRSQTFAYTVRSWAVPSVVTQNEAKSEWQTMLDTEFIGVGNNFQENKAEYANPPGAMQEPGGIDWKKGSHADRLRGSVAACLIHSLGQIDKEQLGRDIEDARTQVGSGIRNFLEQARLRKSIKETQSLPPDRTLIKAPAGIGKTREFVRVAEHYASGHELQILYLAPTHDLLKEVAAKLPKARLVAGREQEGQCQRVEVVQKITELNLPIEQTLCKSCPFRNSCRYQMTLQGIRAERKGMVVLATHQQLTFMRGDIRFDAVVIDEAFIKVMYEVVEFHPDRLEAAKGRDGQLQPGLDGILAAFREDPANLLAGLRRHGFAAADRFEGLVKGLEALVKADQPGMDAGKPDEVLLEELSKAVANETWKVLALVNQLRREIHISRPSANGVEYRAVARVEVEGKLETQERIGVFGLRPLAIGHGVPILMLDATADTVLLQRILGDRIRSEAISVRRNAVIIQATSAQFDRISMLRHESRESPGYRRYLAKFVAGLGAKAPLLITHKVVKERMQEEKLVKKRWHMAHLGAIRGIDRWKDCDAVIIAGRLQPAPRALLSDARCLFNDDPVALETDCELKPAEKSLVGCDATVGTGHYGDPRIQAILEQYREQEISQAVDRLRLINNGETKLVVILGKVGTDIPVDLALSWPQLYQRVVPIIGVAMECEVIRLNAKEAECDVTKPSMWKSGRQFLDDVADIVNEMNSDSKAAYRLMFPFHRVVEYRLIVNGRRQSGKPKKALVQRGTSATDRAIARQYANDSKAIAVEIAHEGPELKAA